MFGYLQALMKYGQYECTVRDVDAFVGPLYFMFESVGRPVPRKVRVPVQPFEARFERIFEGRQILAGGFVLGLSGGCRQRRSSYAVSVSCDFRVVFDDDFIGFLGDFVTVLLLFLSRFHDVFFLIFFQIIGISAHRL